MEVGALVAFALSLQLLFDPVRDLVLQYTQLQRAMAGGERVFEVLDTKPEFEDKADAVFVEDIRGQVDFNDVSFSIRRRRACAGGHRPAREGRARRSRSSARRARERRR